MEWALANKLAAWNERRLIRDLYDVYFMHVLLNVVPDMRILNKRLDRIESVEKSKSRHSSMSVKDFAAELETTAKALSQAKVEQELGDYLGQSEMAGLALKIKLALNTLAEFLRAA